MQRIEQRKLDRRKGGRCRQDSARPEAYMCVSGVQGPGFRWCADGALAYSRGLPGHIHTPTLDPLGATQWYASLSMAAACCSALRPCRSRQRGLPVGQRSCPTELRVTDMYNTLFMPAISCAVGFEGRNWRRLLSLLGWWFPGGVLLVLPEGPFVAACKKVGCMSLHVMGERVSTADAHLSNSA
jgi:hypothetical protein